METLAKKRRCTACKEYFPADKLRSLSLGGVCSEDCRRALQEKYRAKHKRRAYHRANKHKYGRRLPGKVRDAVRERDGSGCRFCGTTAGRIEVHHIQYRSQQGKDVLDNLITLCQEHHSLVHSSKRRWQPVLQMTILCGLPPTNRFVSVPEVERVFGSVLAAEYAPLYVGEAEAEE